MKEYPQRTIFKIKIALLVLHLLAFVTAVGALVLHYINGLLGTSSNVLTNCLIPSTTLKHQNIGTLLLVVTAAIGFGIAFSLLSSIIGIVWVARKDLSRETAEKRRTPLFLLTSISLLGTAIAGGHYASFIVQYNAYSCGGAVQSACLIQAALLGAATVSLILCLILSLALPKPSMSDRPQPNPSNQKQQSQQVQLNPVKKGTRRPLERSRSGIDPTQSQAKQTEQNQPLKSVGGVQPRRFAKFFKKQIPSPSNGMKESARASAAQQEISRNIQKPHQITTMGFGQQGELQEDLLQRSPQPSYNQLTDAAYYQPILPFMSFRNPIPLTSKSVTTTRTSQVKPAEYFTFKKPEPVPVVQAAPSAPSAPPEPIWEYPEVPFGNISDDSNSDVKQADKGPAKSKMQSEDSPKQDHPGQSKDDEQDGSNFVPWLSLSNVADEQQNPPNLKDPQRKTPSADFGPLLEDSI